MAEKDLTARVRVEADDARPIDEIEESLRDLRPAGDAAAGGLRQVEEGADAAAKRLRELDTHSARASKGLRTGLRDLRGFISEGLKLGKVKDLFASLPDAISRLDLGGAVAQVSDLIGRVTEASQKRAQALSKLEGALRSTGKAATFTRGELVELADGLSKVTAVSDEVVLDGQAVLLTFEKIGKDTFPEITERALDLATALGKDVPDAAQLLGQALDDPVKGLSDLSDAGIRFSESQQAAIKSAVESGKTFNAQKIILGDLEERIGGAAREARDSWTGAMDAARNASEDFLQAVGEGGLTSALGRLAERFSTSADGAGSFATKIGQALAFVVEVVGGALTGIKAGFEAIAGAVGIGVAALAEPFLELGSTIADALSNVPGLERFGDRVKTQLGDLAEAVREFRHQTQRETEQNLREARSSLSETVDSIVDIWKNGAERAKEEAQGYSDAAETAGDAFDDLPPRVKETVDEISSLLGTLPDKAKDAAKDLQQAWESFEPEEVSERFEKLSESAQDTFRKSFRAAVETIREAGVEVSDEMLAIGESIGVLAEVSPEVESIVKSIGEKLGLLPAAARQTVDDLRTAWESFDANVVRQAFAGLDDESQEEIKAQFAKAIEAIRAAGGEISEEMALIGNSIGVLVSAFEPVGSAASGAADAVSSSADQISDSITVVVTKYDEAGKKIESVEQVTREAARRMTLEEIEQADPRLQEYVKRLKEAEEGLGQTSTVAKDAADALSDPAQKVGEVSQNVGDLAGKSKELASAQQDASQAAKDQATGLGELTKALTSKDLSQSVADLAAKLEGLNQINFGPLLGQLDAVEQKARSVAQAVASIDEAAEGAPGAEA